MHEQRFYSVLYRLLAKPRHREVRKCISRLDNLNLTKLRVANILPPELCRPNVVEAIPNVQAARDLIATVNILTSAGAAVGELALAITKVCDQIGLTRVINNAMLACRGADHPVPETDTYRPIRTARELHKVATKFRNCARNYTIELLDSEAGHAFAEVSLGREGAVAHLRKREGRWRLEGLFGPRNLMPSRSMRQHVTEHLVRHGVEPRERDRADTKWSPVRRITMAYLYEFEFE